MKISKTTKLGNEGEDLAMQYLIGNGYKIIERNFRQKWGEIDLIGKSPSGILVFFEVKTMQLPIKLPNEILPEDQMTRAKIIKLKRTCYLYANNNSHLVTDLGWRIDLVAVEVYFDYNLNKGVHKIRHYENIIG